MKRVIYFLRRKIWWFFSYFAFKKLGWNTYVKSPIMIQGSDKIILGENVFVGFNSWLAAMPIASKTPCQLIIDDGCSIGNFNHIYATSSVLIGKKVLTADKVYISDNLHGYENVHIPIMDQEVKQIGKVSIGDGSWLGENVCVIGVKIGKNCVIGANSVVLMDIPDYCVAVGSPAIIKKRYCLETNKWRKTDPQGNFKN